jgi:hypothetical protein
MLPLSSELFVILSAVKNVKIKLLLQLCRLSSTAVGDRPSSDLLCNSHWMFRPNWPSSGVHVVCLREPLLRSSTVNTADVSYVGHVL